MARADPVAAWADSSLYDFLFSDTTKKVQCNGLIGRRKSFLASRSFIGLDWTDAGLQVTGKRRDNLQIKGDTMNSELTDFLRKLEQSGFYGSVELKYENGRITIARKSETL